MRLEHWSYILPLRLRSLFRHREVERELDEEIEYHLEKRIDAEKAKGLSAEDARYAALRAMDGMTQRKEECRQARGISAVESTMQDIRYGLRVLGKSPGFTAVAALSLALGIGANTAIFSLINAVMLRTLPVQNPEQLRVLGVTRGPDLEYGFTYNHYRQFREHNQSFQDLAASSPVRLSVSVDGQVEPAVAGQMVSGGYFSVLGVNAEVGRTIGAQDDRVPKGHPVAMISDGFWKRRFARDPGAIGRRILLDGAPFTVIGVTPPGFFGIDVGTAPDVWVSIMMQPVVMPDAEDWLGKPIKTDYWLRIVGRLKPGLSPAMALAEMEVLYRRYAVPDDDVQPKDKIGLAPASRGLSALRREFSEPLLILMTVVGLVLLIACANVASLLLARATARQSELAVRLAIGAGRGRLVRQLLVESLMLAALGGICGILLAYWGSEALLSFISRGRAAIALSLRPDPQVLGFTAAVSAITGILFGIAPALRATRLDLGPSLKSRFQAGGATRGPRLGNVLVIGQVALSLVLLIVAGLFVRSLAKLNGQDAGFPRESVLVMRVEPRGSDQRNLPGVSARLDGIYRGLLERVRAIPGVRAASMAGVNPTTLVTLHLAMKKPSTGELLRVNDIAVYPGYFSTLGIPFLAGRDFTADDFAVSARPAAVINESAARKLFPGENAAGKELRSEKPSRLFQVIGVVRDSHYSNLRGETQALAYLPFLLTPTGRGQMTLHVRIAGNPGAVAPLVQKAVQEIDKDAPLLEVRTLAAEVDAALMQERVIATLSSFFGAVALALAVVGLYGLMAFAVVRRSGEIGIRMAIGAQRRDVLWMVLRDTLALVGVGIAIGVPVALVAMRLASSRISGLLFGLSSGDPVAIGVAVVVMAMAAAVAGYLPARRAARVDPMVVLRNE
ncbi:MAG TPA: ABC transporter permease [Bryobacteraceae bacterium]|nr:ABC transporter permease [Bryobacteraceae bacterium]